MKTHSELLEILEEWIVEGGEIAKVARIRKARLGDCPEDVAVLRVEVENIARYFGREV